MKQAKICVSEIFAVLIYMVSEYEIGGIANGKHTTNYSCTASLGLHKYQDRCCALLISEQAKDTQHAAGKCPP